MLSQQVDQKFDLEETIRCTYSEQNSQEVQIYKSSLSKKNEQSELDIESQIRLKKVLGLPTELPQKDIVHQLDKIFFDRAKDIRVATIVALTSNIFHQIKNLSTIDDMNNRLVIQSIYWISTIITIVLAIISYQKGRLMVIKYGFFLVTMRNILRLYNFERNDTQGTQDLIQQVMCIFMVLLFVMNFQNTPENFKMKFFLNTLWSVAETKVLGLLKFDSLANIFIALINIGIHEILIGTLARLFSRIVMDLMKQTEKNFDMQDELQQILQNLEESIIIMSDFRVDFVNQRFLTDFSGQIIDLVPKDVEEIEQQRKPSKIYRIKFKLQSYFSRKVEGEESKQEAPIPELMRIKLFKIYKTWEKGSLETTSKLNDQNIRLYSAYSFQDIVQRFQDHNLGNIVFMINDENVYFQIKLAKFFRKDREKIMLQFIDISKTILYDLEKSHNIVLSMLNACVSHEMRNPLNSIIAQNIEKKGIYGEINQLINKLKIDQISKDNFLNQHDDAMKTLQNGLRIQQSSSNVLTYIVQDLLDFAQIKSGKFRSNIIEFNIITAIEEVMLIQTRKAQDNNIRLHATFVNIRPDDRDHQIDLKHQSNQYGFMVNTDQQRVMQVLLGLQSNALKFTQGGEVHIIIEIITKEQEKYLQISVKDTGIGIAPENQDKLFKMFGFLDDSQKMNQNGVGLGLVISKQIVQQFEGDITLDSKLGIGSKFTFTFKIYSRQIQNEIEANQQNSEFSYNSKQLVFKWRPTRPDQDVIYSIKQQQKLELEGLNNPIQIRKRSNSQDISKLNFNYLENDNKRILIVDDQSFNIDAIIIILKYSIGIDSLFFCESALSGEQALQMVKDDIESQKVDSPQSKYSLILMDCNMPGMDGLETTHKIRQYLHSEGAAQPIISAITGHVEQKYVDQAILSGMNQVLSKPVNPLILKDLIQQAGFYSEQ